MTCLFFLDFRIILIANLGHTESSCIGLALHGCLANVCLSAVKYIREVSPLFKKPSLVADLPWDGIRPQSPSYSGSEDSGSPKHGSSSSSKDRKVISLKMCFISRNLTMPDLENRYHAPLFTRLGGSVGERVCVRYSWVRVCVFLSFVRPLLVRAEYLFCK